jgi:hypothetical protein
VPLSRPARRTWTAVAAAGLVVVPLVVLTVARAGTTGTGRPAGAAWGTFPPVADGYVNSKHATKSYGGARVLRTDAAPGTVRSYLRFRVGGLAGPVRAATLRLFAESGSRNGLEVRGVADTGWDERRLQFVTAPPVQSAVASIGPIRARTWVTANVTALVKGNGDVGMALVGLGATAVRYASREAGSLAPQLVVHAGSERPLATPARPSGVAEGGEVVVAAAGDIACHPDEIAAGNRPCRQGTTADLLAGLPLDAVLPLGDLQYQDGDLGSFQAVYHPSWGRFKAISRPAVGNHEYGTRGAAGYFSYWGAVAGDPATGWYSYDLGSWHLIALNSGCSHIGGCGPGSPQEQWLRADLAAHPAACTLAYWHEPRFSSGQHGDKPSLDGLWRALHEAGAEVVLNGHDHDYERFAPQDPQGTLDDTRGIRQFVVGTGGANHYRFETVRPNSEVRNADTFGVLVLTLGTERYDWRFVPEPGKEFTDAGTGECH